MKLFIKKVFITDKLDNILPKYLRFVSGIIDSEDISLNISREMLQNDPIVAKIKSHLTKKVLSELKTELKKSKDNYINFWKNFGSVMKEGFMKIIQIKKTYLIFHYFIQVNQKTNYYEEYLNNKKKDQNEIFTLVEII